MTPRAAVCETPAELPRDKAKGIHPETGADLGIPAFGHQPRREPMARLEFARSFCLEWDQIDPGLVRISGNKKEMHR